MSVHTYLHDVGRWHHVRIDRDESATYQSRFTSHLNPVAVVYDFIGDANYAAQNALAVAVVQVIIERRYRLAQHNVGIFKSLFYLEGAYK